MLFRSVGYGDIYPITPLGRFLGAIIAILGIGMVAVPTSILSAGFMELLETRTGEGADQQKSASPEHAREADHPAAADSVEPPRYCPHCGKKLFP